MTREAKIGMLTGLGVIVLIGVLLSEYLGDARSMSGPLASALVGTGVPPTASATGRMAELPVGAQYRQQVLEPIGVPGMARADAPLTGMQSPGAPAGMMVNVPPAFAREPAISQVELPLADAGPTISAPVAPIAMGRSPVEERRGPGSGPPTISVQESRAVTAVAMMEAAPLPQQTATPRPASPVPGRTYVIAAGDSLAKIAKKFYASSKLSDVNRIVAANPVILKNAESTLHVGKTLTIPNVAAPAATPAPPAPITPEPVAPAAPAVPARPALRPVQPVARPPAPAAVASSDAAQIAALLAETTEPVMLYLPGTPEDRKALVPAPAPRRTTTPVNAKTPAAPAPVKKERTYEVQRGDTLEKIAKRYGPSNPSAMLARLKAANGMKNSATLQAGQKLRIP